METETLHETYSVPYPAKLDVSNLRGWVDIQSGEEGKIEITVTKYPRSGDASNTHIEFTQREDGSVAAITRYPMKAGAWARAPRAKPCKVTYQIRVPPATSIALKLVSSSGRISGKIAEGPMEGRFDLESVSGDVSLEELRGRLQWQGVSGNLTARHILGSARIDTVSGDIHLESSALEEIIFSGVSSDFFLESPLLRGPYRFDSVSGDVSLAIPAPVDAVFSLTSLNGKIDCAPDLPSPQRHAGGQRLTLGAGTSPIAMESISGDLILIPAAEIQLPPTAGKPFDLDILAILDKIDRAELSVEEGLKALR